MASTATLLFIAAFVVITVVVIVLLLIFQPWKSTVQGVPPPPPDTRSGLFGSCPCLDGLTCTSQGICLTSLGGRCTDNGQCATGRCFKSPGATLGVCDLNNGPGPAPDSVETEIYIWQNERWILGVSITPPQGTSISRISSLEETAIGISRLSNNAYLYTPEKGWQNITTNITPPGTLLDAAISGNPGSPQIWLVYRISGGDTLLYRLFNQTLIPVGDGGGIQMTDTGYPISIREVRVHSDETTYLVGSTSGGLPTIYRKSPGMTVYSPVAMGENFTFVPRASSNNFAYSSGNSIIILGINSTRIDNIRGPITSIAMTPEYIPWYLAGGAIYRQQSRIDAPTSIRGGSNLFYSSTGINLAVAV